MWLMNLSTRFWQRIRSKKRIIGPASNGYDTHGQERVGRGYHWKIEICSWRSGMPTLVDRSETLAVEVAWSDDALTVVLDDGRTVSVPLVWFPRLLNVTRKQRKEWEFIGGGIGIH
jgi:hypothetical protein